MKCSLYVYISKAYSRPAKVLHDLLIVVFYIVVVVFVLIRFALYFKTWSQDVSYYIRYKLCYYAVLVRCAGYGIRCKVL